MMPDLAELHSILVTGKTEGINETKWKEFNDIVREN